MDEPSAARRANLHMVKDERMSSGVVPTSVDTSSLGITVGTVLDDRYLVGRFIGAGAVGIVFEARNIELDAKVAIKCLRPEMLADEKMVARFAREAKAAASIKSEYAATVHDVGASSDGTPYIVMEFLEGRDLGAIVRESGPFGPRTAVEYTLQVCEALAVAHSKAIVHRDVRPENLVLCEREGGTRIVKVVDFGISKSVLVGSIFGGGLPLVRTINPTAKPLYLSPEQVRRSDSVDVRSDIWSLGMVLYELLTGHTALGGGSITEICAAILEKTPTPIGTFRSDLPPGLVDVISKCLEKDVERRYQTVAELALALLPFAPKRTRLNVERAVALLQGAGQLDPALHVASTTPPPDAGALLSSSAVPPPPPPPSDPLLDATAPAPIAEAVAPSVADPIAEAPPSEPSPVSLETAMIVEARPSAPSTPEAIAPAVVAVTSAATPEKPRPIVAIVAVLGVLALAAIGAVVLSKASSTDTTKPEPTVTTTQAERKPEPPEAPPEPAVTVTAVRPEAPAPLPTVTSAPVKQEAPPPSPPAHTAAPRAPAPPVLAPAPAPASASAAPSPSASTKPSENEDEPSSPKPDEGEPGY